MVNELPEGYHTHAGEGGVRLSGGQRRRIGIARALSHGQDVLIMNEATSTLDNPTDHALMEAVRNLGSRKTIIRISQILSTVRRCDRIYLIEQGRLVAAGTYGELVESNERSRSMTEVV